MNYETLPNGLRVPKIGFGCWKIGGEHSPDPSKDGWSLAALRSALELGYISTRRKPTPKATPRN